MRQSHKKLISVAIIFDDLLCLISMTTYDNLLCPYLCCHRYETYKIIKNISVDLEHRVMGVGRRPEKVNRLEPSVM